MSKIAFILLGNLADVHVYQFTDGICFAIMYLDDAFGLFFNCLYSYTIENAKQAFSHYDMF